jgi:hypothetical protein
LFIPQLTKDLRADDKALLPMLKKVTSSLVLASLFAAVAADAADKIALRAANGRFLRAGANGEVRAEAYFPGESETFELIPRGEQQIALKGPSGRYVVPDTRDGRLLRLGKPGLESGPTFQMVAAGATRFALRPQGAKTLVRFDPAGMNPAARTTPAAGETVELCRVRPLPAVQTALAIIVQGVAAQELTGKQYDKTGTHETNKYIEVPAPSFKDPLRKKRIQVLGMTEEYRVQAQLDGDAEIHVPTLLYLVNFVEGGAGMLLVAADARLPVRGRVQAKVPGLVNISTGYRAVIQLSATAGVEVRHAGKDVTIGPCTVLDLRALFSRLDLSNDLLEAARRPIKSFINRELRRNEEQIHQSANQSLQKAISSHELRLPLLGYLGLP